MTTALRCINCRAIFAPFGTGDTRSTLVANFSSHPCASTIVVGDEAARPEVLVTRHPHPFSFRVHPSNGGAA